LTISYGYTTALPIAVPKAPKKKRSLLPLLTVLFLFSYALMTLLIMQQGSVIQSQRNLINTLMRDSTELWAAKGRALGDRKAQSHSRAPSSQAPAAKAPSTQTPSNQVPQRRAQNQSNKTAKPAPPVPPVPASDLVDQRRGLTTI
jgi:hypothetical protein